jgi:hypothetical protein
MGEKDRRRFINHKRVVLIIHKRNTMQERKPGCICELDTESGEPVVDNYAECPVHKPDAVTPFETATSLVKSFIPYAEVDTVHGSSYYAKECAKICVGEILSVLDTFQTHAYAKVLIPYYNEVKQEIQNL